MAYKTIYHLTSHLPYLSDLISKYSPRLGSLHSSTLTSLLFPECVTPTSISEFILFFLWTKHSFLWYLCGWLHLLQVSAQMSLFLWSILWPSYKNWMPLLFLFLTLFLFLVPIAIRWIVWIYFVGGLFVSAFGPCPSATHFPWYWFLSHN